MLQAPHLLWRTHNPPGHVGKHTMILPDTCQQTSHQGLSCVTPNDIAWQDQSLATLQPILSSGEVGRTMLIGSDPPRLWGEIAFIQCSVPDLFKRNWGAATHLTPSSTFKRQQKPMSICMCRGDIVQELHG